MTTPSVKELVVEAARALPDDVTFDDVIERLYFLSKVHAGLSQVAAGETIPHEEAVARLLGE